MNPKQDLERRLNFLRRGRTSKEGLAAEAEARFHLKEQNWEAAEREVVTAERESEKFNSVKVTVL